MKKLFVPLAAAAVLAVVRAVTALSLAEPQTGFFPAGTAGFYTAALLLLTLTYVVSSTYNPFIYFNF